MEQNGMEQSETEKKSHFIVVDILGWNGTKLLFRPALWKVKNESKRWNYMCR